MYELEHSLGVQFMYEFEHLEYNHRWVPFLQQNMVSPPLLPAGPGALSDRFHYIQQKMQLCIISWSAKLRPIITIM